MRVPHEWLREHCDPGLPAGELGERLTMSGTKVEAIHHHGVRATEHFVVGKVLEAVQHPDADRLRVCTVDVGDGGEPQGIVCGAPNVAAGQTVAVARPGSIMPDGTRLKRAKLRGVVSNGMICAEDELGIGTDHDGILVLADGLRAGTPLADVLPIATEVIEFEITPNRPDCLGVFGIAREVHATTGAPLGPPPWAQDPGTPGDVEGIEVRVEAPERNPRFTARAFDDVRVGPSPPWLKARLMAAGVRPINNVVDITNYVMLLAGHPMHAFDLDRVSGGVLVVRRAGDGERVRTLDGIERSLDSGMLVIDDADGPTSIAGIMGGERSEVHEGTTTVLMEAASWDGHMIQTASTRLALRSEASGRFEKGLAPEQAMEAQALAARLMVELTGATLRPGTVDVRAEGVPAPRPVIRFRTAQTARLLGRDVPAERQAEILRALEFEVADDWSVTVPAFRRDDVTREADLVEEVARIDGLANLPATLPKRRDTAGRLPLPARLRRRAVDALVGRGLLEVAGWSFTHPGLVDRLRLAEDDPRRALVVLENPMSEDQSVLRPTLLGSLLDVAQRNAARGAGDLALFEQGAVYRLPLDPLPQEHRALGAVLTGRALTPPTWRDARPAPADAFAAKALVEAVFAALRVPLAVEAAPEPFLHPGRSARVLAAGEPVGWVGEVHPRVARAWELDGPVAAFEVDLDALVARADAEPRFRALSEFPPLRQDLAVVLPDDVPAARVLEAVRRAGGALLADVRVFDVFRGEQVGAGRVSLALALAFRAPDRTLSDEDVAPVRAKVVAALGELGGELRG